MTIWKNFVSKACIGLCLMVALCKVSGGPPVEWNSSFAVICREELLWSLHHRWTASIVYLWCTEIKLGAMLIFYFGLGSERWVWCNWVIAVCTRKSFVHWILIWTRVNILEVKIRRWNTYSGERSIGGHFSFALHSLLFYHITNNTVTNDLGPHLTR